MEEERSFFITKGAKTTRLYEKSFQGKRHKEREMPCQDCSGHCATPNGWIAAAVADGVSSSALSEVGAEIAVRSCQEYFSDFRYSPFLDAERIQDILCDAFNYALRKIKESDLPGKAVPFSKYTTLQLVLYGEKIGLHWGQAGDGGIYIRNGEGKWKRLGEPMKHGEENSPVTLQDGPNAWRFGSVDAQELEAVLLTTDGLADVLPEESGKTDVTEELLGLLAAPPDPDKEQTDAYYQELLFGQPDSFIKKYSVSPEAAARLKKVTDDITILLISSPSGREDTADTHEEQPRESGSATRPVKQKEPVTAILRRLLKKIR